MFDCNLIKSRVQKMQEEDIPSLQPPGTMMPFPSIPSMPNPNMPSMPSMPNFQGPAMPSMPNFQGPAMPTLTPPSTPPGPMEQPRPAPTRPTTPGTPAAPTRPTTPATPTAPTRPTTPGTPTTPSPGTAPQRPEMTPAMPTAPSPAFPVLEPVPPITPSPTAPSAPATPTTPTTIPPRSPFQTGPQSEIPVAISPLTPGLAPSGEQMLTVPSNPLVAPEYSQILSFESLQYLNGYLRTKIGEYVEVEFLIGTSNRVIVYGVLTGVGLNYITLRDPVANTDMACDFYNIKFVRILPAFTLTLDALEEARASLEQRTGGSGAQSGLQGQNY